MEKSYNFGLKMLDSSIVSKQTAWFDNNNRNNQENENFSVQKWLYAVLLKLNCNPCYEETRFLTTSCKGKKQLFV